MSFSNVEERLDRVEKVLRIAGTVGAVLEELNIRKHLLGDDEKVAARQVEKSLSSAFGSLLDFAIEEKSSPTLRTAVERFPKGLRRKLKKNRPKKYLCCSKPKLHTARRGQRIWISICKFKDYKGVIRGMPFIVGKNPKERPNKLTIRGKRMRIC